MRHKYRQKELLKQIHFAHGRIGTHEVAARNAKARCGTLLEGAADGILDNGDRCASSGDC